MILPRKANCANASDVVADGRIVYAERLSPFPNFPLGVRMKSNDEVRLKLGAHVGDGLTEDAAIVIRALTNESHLERPIPAPQHFWRQMMQLPEGLLKERLMPQLPSRTIVR